MTAGRRAISALCIAGAIAGGSLALAQELPPITPGAPASPLHIPRSPGVPLVIETAGEYQIDGLGAPLDTQLALYRGDDLVARDDDSGEETNARIVTFLDPATYELRPTERRGRVMSVRLSATQLPPMSAAAATTPGAPPVDVEVHESSVAREASAEVTLTIATAGTYRIDATSDTALDAELLLLRNGALLASDSGSAGGPSAQVAHALTPGEYAVRVRDRRNRGGTLSVQVTGPGAQ